MAGKKVYENVYHVTRDPVAGIPLYPNRGGEEPSMEELLKEQEKRELREAQKEEYVAKMEVRTKKLRGTAEDEKPTQSPKRYLVDPDTGTITVDEEEGEYTAKDAALISASIKGKGGHYDEAITLIKMVKELGQDSQVKLAEKPKEYYVDETGIIVKDTENGEYTLSEARAISQSLQKSQAPDPSQQAPGVYVDEEGEVHPLKPGEPVVVKKVDREPGKTYVLNQQGEPILQEAGKPIVIKVESQGGSATPMLPFPAMARDGQPMLDEAGNPIFVDIEPQLKWLNFQGEQRRAEDRHSMWMGMGKQMREEILPSIPAGIQAILDATKETKEERKGSPETKSSEPQSFKCGDCGTEFSPPSGWAGQPIKCACGRIYTKEELMG